MAMPVGVAPVLLLLLLPLAAATAAAESDDRDALMAFKAGVTSDPTGVLRSWNETVHFCRWPGVNCTAGRVTSLDVSMGRLAGELSPAVANLTRLVVLNLTSNAFSGSIPGGLGRLRRMRYLSLCDNAFAGEIPDALRNCTALAVAYLNNNNLVGGVPRWLGALPNLAVLRLSHNSLSGRIPPSLANLTKIFRLELDQNLLEGSIPDGLSRLPALGMLALSQNSLAGEIPVGFFNMTSLRGLALADNAFRGELPGDAGARTPNLQYLFLGGNLLAGPIPASLSNATALVALSLANNSFAGQVPGEIGTLCPLSLELSNNQLTATDDAGGGWEFVDNLTNCSALAEILLDGNKFAGVMPRSVVRLSPQLEALNLAGNRISGVIPPEIESLVGLQTLSLQSNLFSGEIPEAIGKLKNLRELLLEQNELAGPVPSAIGDLTQLLKLDLSGNSLNGSIPPSLGNLHQLTLLNLSGNELTGHVPSELFTLSSLSLLMDLSDNQLDGPIPPDVGQLTKLAFMALSGNRFSGEVPTELESCQSLEFLDLAGNVFVGSIPPSLSGLKGLRRLNLTGNRLSGSIPPELGGMPGLQELYLSRNDLSGGIPASLATMSSLMELDVSYNRLAGQVPVHGVFANTTGLRIAGNTALCGGAARLRLPPCPAPGNSTRRAHLFLKIALPVVAAALCFAVMFAALRWRRKIRSSRTGNAAARSVLNGNYYPRVTYAELAKATDDFADANLVGAGKYGSVYRGTLSLKTKGEFAREDAVVAVKVLDLRQVGASKTFMAECEALRSVKHRNLINIVTCCSSIDMEGNEFRALVFDFMPNYSLDRWLHRAKHTETGKWCGGAGGLGVIQRLDVAVDIADALNYLHNSCNPPIIHCDLKPSNVLLGEDMTACIGDFGLAKLLLDPASHGAAAANTESTIGIRGTIGYVAPEYGTMGMVTASGDVYSFGITLLEIFSGKAPTDGELRDGLTLPEFVAGAFPDNIEEILDVALLLQAEELDGAASSTTSEEESEARVTVRDCLASAIRVGLSCSRRAPYERMAMSVAADEMRLIRDACLRACGK
ncbi:putative receptor-like protein kinase At3g47110 [Oryza glaberrima]|uniref:Receptor kinase-like protein Xa21 n=1 Tax=Oryza glaberrima TaxID=4538 RepID=I1Q4G1_ORYGL|nr:putative receptor-like protein kinase At3g47110 [Oryza glaberrima]